MDDIHLNSPIRLLRGIGTSRELALNKKNIYIVQDVLNYMPRIYRDTRNILTVSQVYNVLTQKAFTQGFDIHITKAIVGQVTKIKQIRTPLKKMYVTEIELQDMKTKDKLIIKYFNQRYIINTIKDGEKYVFWGRIKLIGSVATLFNPEFERFIALDKLKKFGKIMPIYPQSKLISQSFIRKLLYQTLPVIDKDVIEFIPTKLLNQNNFLSIKQSYKEIHFPNSLEQLKKAYARLATQEFLELLANRPNTYKTTKGIFQKDPNLKLRISKHIKNILTKLPYKLTNDQLRAIQDILNNYSKGNQSVFLYGDVGAGKTLVFLILAIAFLKAKQSSVLVAPTTILAYQHYETFNKLTSLFQIQNQLQVITSKTKSLSNTNNHQIIIATQAIFYKDSFVKNLKQLALIAFDEEQRFGTNQRLQLLNKKEITPYYLGLSATPIPQTLAQAFLGYTKAIYIRNKPFKSQIKTYTIRLARLNELLTWLKKQLKKGEQAYIVFPRIEPTENTINIQDYKDQIIKLLKPYKVEIVHGKIKGKDRILSEFAKGNISVLISTSLIEVGIDAPKASIIIILGAEQFGLSQLHQLRGRVGRRGQQGFCFVIPSVTAPQTAVQRLQKFSAINDGIKLAKLDLELRGPGEIFNGIEQTGLNKLKIASPQNYKLMKISLDIFNELNEKDIKILKYIYHGKGSRQTI